MGRLTPQDKQDREEHTTGRYYRRNRPERAKRTWLPLLIFAAIGLFIVTQEVPQVGDWVDQIVRPDVWQARQTCREAAMAAVERPQYARLMESGRVHKTGDGYLVEALVLGEMGATGAEVQTAFNCYLDSNGELVKSASRPYNPQQAPAQEQAFLGAED